MELISLKGKNKIKYFEDFMVLDTETSHINELGWVNSIQLLDYNDDYFQFRKPSELCRHLLQVRESLDIKDEEYMVVYVHNLSYDNEYLFQWLYESLGQPQDGLNELYTQAHKPIYIRFNGFEFRCSYRLANRSLDKWSKDLNTENRKAVSTYDYSKIIYQDTPLNEMESNYDRLDVIVLKECLIKQMELYGDNVATIPYTRTGYVRRRIKKDFQGVCHENARKVRDSNYFDFRDKKIDVNTYKDLSAVKNGGITHGNRFLKGKKIVVKDGERGVHVDLISAYPSTNVVDGYPVGKWFLSLRKFNTIDEVLEYANNYALLVRIKLTNVRIHDEVTLPFLQSYKCELGKKDGYTSINDNGRVLYTIGTCEVVFSDIMLNIINEQYDFDYEIVSVRMSRKGKLPKYIIDATKEFFYNKTKYKDIAERYDNEYGFNDPRTTQAHMELLESKSLLNAIFGMTYEDIVKDLFEYDYYLNEFKATRNHRNDEEIEEQINKHYNNRSKFNRMEFGMYTTEHVKNQIYQAVKRIGYENFCYCDTDSIFYIENDSNRGVFDEINREMREKAIDNNGWIEYDGKKTYFYGFGKEKDFKEFKFLHSKCYAMTTIDNEFILTVAGVPKDNKKKGKAYVTREMEICGYDDFEEYKKLTTFNIGYENFDVGFVFNKCKSTTAKYIACEPHIEIINGHATEVANSCIIEDCEKTLRDSVEELTFDDLINMMIEGE